MSKALENMTLEELSQYMKAHKDDRVEWKKAYDLFAQKSDWQEVPEGSTWEEELEFIENFVAQVMG
jgi:hypothetical protein